MQSQQILAQDTLRLRLARAREAEHLGDYDHAARLLADEWPGVDHRPDLCGLDEADGAELLLRAGALTGYIGSAAQTPGAQEQALDLLTESHTTFSRLRLHERIAEARIELATCYRRKGAFDASRAMLDTAKGAFDAARAMLDSASELLDSDTSPYLRALAAIRRVITETCAGELDEAERRVAEAEPLVSECESPALRGRYFNEFGAVLFFLSEREGGEPRWGEALEKFVAARLNFERAGHLRYSTVAENNMAYALVKLGRLTEARRHVLNARRFALCVDDRGQLALIDDTDAHLLTEENRLVEAEAVSRARLDEMRGTDHGALHAENLTTHAVLLARLGRAVEAAREFDRAAAVAELAGDARGVEKAEEARASELRQDNVLPFRAAAEQCALAFEWRAGDNSLRDIGIRKGDAVRFTVSEHGRSGDLVAALTHAGRFVKIIYMEGGGVVRLEGAHPRCPPRRYMRDEVSILGVARPRPE
jgi:tetratricopeptide (TPR) repeat protein